MSKRDWVIFWWGITLGIGLLLATLWVLNDVPEKLAQ